MTVHGGKASTGTRELVVSHDHENPFERGQLDTFELRSVPLGGLVRLSVWIDGSGHWSRWLLDR